MAYWGTIVFQGYPSPYPTPFCPCCGQPNGAYYPNPHPPYQPVPVGYPHPPYQPVPIGYPGPASFPVPPPPPHSGPPPVATPPSSYVDPQPMPFDPTLLLDVTGADDWEDIPSAPLHMSEEEEDARFQVATGQITEDALKRVLDTVHANTADIKIEIP